MSSLPSIALDRCPDAVFVIRVDGRFAYVNRTACQWLLYRREDLIELSLWDIDSRYNRDEWPGNWKVLQENRLLAVKSEHVRRDGTAFPVEVIAMLEESNDNGKPTEIAIAYVRNLTDPKRQLELTVRGVLRERALSRLNGQERSVFELLERDASEKDITQQLNMSRSTFYRIKRRIASKLGVDGAESGGFWW